MHHMRMDYCDGLPGDAHNINCGTIFRKPNKAAYCLRMDDFFNFFYKFMRYIHITQTNAGQL